jgi:hypothetical protein
MKLFRLPILFAIVLALPAFAVAQAADTSVEDMQVISFPIDKTIELAFVPDPKFSMVTGKAEIDLNERGMASIHAQFKNLPSVFDLGSLYASYIFWAVLPDGSSQRLGEIKVNPKSKLSDPGFEIEVPLNTFGMFVTIEPHYLVREPSRSIVLKSSTARGKDGQVTKASLVQCTLNEDYFRNRPKLDKKKEKEFRETPISYIAAQNAVALARYAGAETYSPELYNESVSLLEEVQQLVQANAKEKEIDLLANKTVGIAANSEKNAVEMKKERKIQLTETRANRELADLKEELTATGAQKELLADDLERVRREKENLQRSFDEKFSQSVRLEQENREMRAKLDQLMEDSSRLKAENQRLGNIINYEKEFPILQKFLSIFGKVEKKENDLVLILPNSIWSKQERAALDTAQLERLQPLLEKIGETAYLRLTIFSFVNSNSELIESQQLADTRAKIFTELFTKGGVDSKRIVSKAFLQNREGKPSKKAQPSEADRIEITFTMVE